MGFWNGFIKMAQGKPVFDAAGGRDGQGQPASPATNANASSTASATDVSGYKIIPEISLEHCKSHLSGSEMEVTVWVTNRSTVELELDKMVMLGMTMQLDRFLAPGEARELRLYKGKTPTDDNYHTANLYYKQVSSGDYFCADYTIGYNYDSEGFYEVKELHPIRPVRDV